MNKPLDNDATASAIATLRPVDLKYLPCHIEAFMMTFPFSDAWRTDELGAAIA